jgi:uncharacterized membrane protein YedE/YeeE
MNIAWDPFTPWHALAGGLLIGLAIALYLLGVGRIAGIAGIVAEPLMAALQGLRGAKAAGPLRRGPVWKGQGLRLAFVAGLLLAPWAWMAVAPLPAARVDVGTWGLVAAGLLVGVGSRMGNGCTSGHGVCGLSRLSLRSLVNVLTFMAAGVATVFVLRHLL